MLAICLVGAKKSKLEAVEWVLVDGLLVSCGNP